MLIAVMAYAIVLALIAASALVASTSAARKRSVSSNKQAGGIRHTFDSQAGAYQWFTQCM